MVRTILAAAAALSFAAFPAHAGSEWSERVDLCAEALGAEGLVNVDDYRVRFSSGGGGATKKVTVKLLPKNGGDKLSAECKIRRGEVVSAELQA